MKRYLYICGAIYGVASLVALDIVRLVPCWLTGLTLAYCVLLTVGFVLEGRKAS